MLRKFPLSDWTEWIIRKFVSSINKSILLLQRAYFGRNLGAIGIGIHFGCVFHLYLCALHCRAIEACGVEDVSRKLFTNRRCIVEFVCWKARKSSIWWRNIGILYAWFGFVVISIKQINKGSAESFVFVLVFALVYPFSSLLILYHTKTHTHTHKRYTHTNSVKKSTAIIQIVRHKSNCLSVW